jgi:hypothetical protein
MHKTSWPPGRCHRRAALASWLHNQHRARRHGAVDSPFRRVAPLRLSHARPGGSAGTGALALNWRRLYAASQAAAGSPPNWPGSMPLLATLRVTCRTRPARLRVQAARRFRSSPVFHRAGHAAVQPRMAQCRRLASRRAATRQLKTSGAHD